VYIRSNADSQATRGSNRRISVRSVLESAALVMKTKRKRVETLGGEFEPGLPNWVSSELP
jgi:hypothetical protein